MAKLLRCGEVLPGSYPVVIEVAQVAEVLITLAQPVKKGHGIPPLPRT
jgi:hypothetical protein